MGGKKGCSYHRKKYRGDKGEYCVLIIIDPVLKFTGAFGSGNTVKHIIIHHALKSACSVWDVHGWHLQNGWIGVGYHFFISKKGEIYKGRPVTAPGAHCSEQSMNRQSVGICLEGCYEEYGTQTDKVVPQAQLEALTTLVKDLMRQYSVPPEKVLRHGDVATYKKCPGDYFPWEAFKEELQEHVDRNAKVALLLAKVASALKDIEETLEEVETILTL